MHHSVVLIESNRKSMNFSGKINRNLVYHFVPEASSNAASNHKNEKKGGGEGRVVFYELANPIFRKLTNAILSFTMLAVPAQASDMRHQYVSVPLVSTNAQGIESGNTELAIENVRQDEHDTTCTIAENEVVQKRQQRFWFVPVLVMMLLGFIGVVGLLYDSNYSAVLPNGEVPATLNCFNYFWSAPWGVSSSCGLGGIDCGPMDSRTAGDEDEDDGWSTVRCPRACGAVQGDRTFGSNNSYSGESRVCPSAVHAGAISDDGGCVQYRFTGSRDSYDATLSNGVQSRKYGWFPKTLEFRSLSAEDADACQPPRRWLVDIYALIVLSILALVFRPPAFMMWTYVIILGFTYIVLGQSIGDENSFWQRFNAASTAQFGLVMTVCLLLWPVFARDTFPVPARLPLDSLLFYLVPFWVVIHMEDFTELGIGSFRSVSLSSGGAADLIPFILMIVAILALTLPLVFIAWHRRMEYRLIKVGLPILVFVVLVLGAMLLAAEGRLSIHMHHYIVGLLIFPLTRGQSRCRFTIVAQGVGLALFVHGVAYWGAAPLFDFSGISESVVAEGEITNNAEAIGYYNIVNNAAPVWLAAQQDNASDSQSLTLSWILPQHIALLGCQPEILGLVSGLERVVVAAQELQQQSLLLWQQLVEPRENWKFTVTVNNVPLVHRVIDPVTEVNVEVEMNSGQLEQVPVPLFAVDTGKLPTSGTFVFRMARFQSESGYGSTTSTFYENATRGIDEEADDWLMTTLAIENSVGVNICGRINETYYSMGDEDGRCFCNGFY